MSEHAFARRQRAYPVVEARNQLGDGIAVPHTAGALRWHGRQGDGDVEPFGILNHSPQGRDCTVGAAADIRAVEEIVGAFHQQHDFRAVLLQHAAKTRRSAIGRRFTADASVDDGD